MKDPTIQQLCHRPISVSLRTRFSLYRYDALALTKVCLAKPWWEYRMQLFAFAQPA